MKQHNTSEMLSGISQLEKCPLVVILLQEQQLTLINDRLLLTI